MFLTVFKDVTSSLLCLNVRLCALVKLVFPPIMNVDNWMQLDSLILIIIIIIKKKLHFPAWAPANNINLGQAGAARGQGSLSHKNPGTLCRAGINCLSKFQRTPSANEQKKQTTSRSITTRYKYAMLRRKGSSVWPSSAYPQSADSHKDWGTFVHHFIKSHFVRKWPRKQQRRGLLFFYPHKAGSINHRKMVL